MAEGVLDAPGRPDALRQIETLGLRPVNVSEKARQAKNKNGTAAIRSAGNFSFKFESKKVSREGAGKFHAPAFQLAGGGRAVEPRAGDSLQEKRPSPAARAKWKEIHDLVVDGLSLADAMAKSPETFPRVYVAMVEAGEAGGFLDVVLAQIAEFQSREKELKSKVLTAMLYPCILLVLAIGRADRVADVFHPEIPKHF